MKRHHIFTIIACIMLLAFLAACNRGDDAPAQGAGQGPAAAGEADPFGRFENTVVMYVGRGVVGDPAFDEGQDMENNIYIDIIKESLNIDLRYEWLAPPGDLETRIGLVLASGDMPDAMLVGNRQQLMQLFEAGMLLDLTDAFYRYASDLTMRFYEGFMRPDDTMVLQSIRYNDRILALPNTNIAYQYTLTWIRRDWMEAVGETAPSSMEDLLRIARTFVEQDPGGNGAGNTIGFVTSRYMAGHYNDVAVLDNIFSYFMSFPRQWIFDADTGQYVFGTIMPETRDALEFVAGLFAEGLIDPEFVTSDRAGVIASGRVGIVLGPWWQPWWPLAATLEPGNPGAVWDPFFAPIGPDGYYWQPVPNPHTNWIVASRDFAYPEAIVKMFNLTNFILGQEAEADEVFPNTNITHGEIYNMLNRSWTMWPFPIQMIWNDGVLRIAYDLRNSLAMGRTYTDNPSTQAYIDGYLGFQANPGADTEHTLMYMNTRSVILQLENNHLMRYPRIGFPGVTDTMIARWAHLTTMADTAMIEIVMGIQPIEHFDEFVEQWFDQGGRDITAEVNAVLLP